MRTSAVRKTKAEAQAWAIAEEAAILASLRGQLPDYTLKQAIARYRKEVINLKKAPTTAIQQTAWASRVALHTSLRSQEILGMRRDNVDLKRRVYYLTHHKTSDHVGDRIVPLPRRCIPMLTLLDQAAAAAERNEYFTISDSSRDALYRKLRDRVMVEGLRFHDLRGTALTLLSKKMDVMTLARVSGHKNINELYNTYYRETEIEIAARI